ncbi:hypothetical protein C8F01DRAFT_1307899 [Mycena amicta]|nr:hypothetical protein C8F01DRAFT_1307899 [Mycena amicta]
MHSKPAGTHRKPSTLVDGAVTPFVTHRSAFSLNHHCTTRNWLEMPPKAASRPKAQNEPTWRMAVTPVGHFACVQDGCSYTCPRKQDVKRHHKTHLAAAEKGKLSIACTWPGCTKKFLQKGNADTHMRVHTHERNQICPEDGCDYTNTDPSSLIRHRRRKHNYQSNAGPRQSRKRVLEGTSSDDVAQPTGRKRAKTGTSTVEDDELHSISAPSPAASTSTNDSFYPPSSAISPPAMYPSLPEPQYDGGSEYSGMYDDAYPPPYYGAPSYFSAPFDPRLTSPWDGFSASQQYSPIASTSSNFQFPQSDFTFVEPPPGGVHFPSSQAVLYDQTNTLPPFPQTDFTFGVHYSPYGASYPPPSLPPVASYPAPGLPPSVSYPAAGLPPAAAPQAPSGLDDILAMLHGDIAQIRAERPATGGAASRPVPTPFLFNTCPFFDIMFTKAVLPCLSLLLALAAQTSAYAIPSRSLVARHHTNVVIVCDADSDCNGMTMAGPDALNNTSTLGKTTSNFSPVISCPTPSNAGDAMECTGVAVAPGTAFDPTQSQIACSIPTGVGSDFSCTSSFATAAGTPGRPAFNLGVQLNCDIPHDVGDVLNCVGNAMTAPAPLANVAVAVPVPAKKTHHKTKVARTA